MEFLIVLVLIGIVWMISPRRWRKSFLLPFTIILLFCVAITSPWGIDLATKGLTINLAEDTGETVQAIVVLGRGEDFRQRRMDRVEKLWQQQRAPTIFASGMLDAEFMLEHFESKGIPKTVLSGERCSHTTEENALFTSAVLYPRQVRKILLITDTPHILRSTLLFQSMGFQVIPYPVSLPERLSTREKSFLLLREYLALMTYTITDRFRARSVEELQKPPVDVAFKLVDWNCQLPMKTRSSD